MDIIAPYYRIDTILVNERELTHRLEQARIAALRTDRSERRRPRPVTTGSIATVPATSH
jgi:hypothetical protein